MGGAKAFAVDLWQKKKCFFPIMANIFDQSSDMGVILILSMILSNY